jgi:hypothetical protein
MSASEMKPNRYRLAFHDDVRMIHLLSVGRPPAAVVQVMTTARR